MNRTHRHTDRTSSATPWVPQSEASEFLNSRVSPDYRALTGDPSDGIPGIAGIGPKTAAALLGGGTGLEGLRDSPRLAARHREAIASSWDRLLTWRDIIRLNDRLPLAETAASGLATAPLPRAAEILDRVGLW